MWRSNCNTPSLPFLPHDQMLSTKKGIIPESMPREQIARESATPHVTTVGSGSSNSNSCTSTIFGPAPARVRLARFESKVDTSSETFKKNHQEMSTLVAELKAKLEDWDFQVT